MLHLLYECLKLNTEKPYFCLSCAGPKDMHEILKKIFGDQIPMVCVCIVVITGQYGTSFTLHSVFCTLYSIFFNAKPANLILVSVYLCNFDVLASGYLRTRML